MLKTIFNFLRWWDNENHVRTTERGRKLRDNNPLSYEFSRLVSSRRNGIKIENGENVVITKGKDSAIVTTAMHRSKENT